MPETFRATYADLGKQILNKFLRMSEQNYDYIIAGGGAAGLSLAVRLLSSPLRTKRLLLIDQANPEDNKTWGFWTRHPEHYNHLSPRIFHHFHVATAGFQKQLSFTPFQYLIIDRQKLYDQARKLFNENHSAIWIEDEISKIENHSNGAVAKTACQNFFGQYVFNNCYTEELSNRIKQKNLYLELHFVTRRIAADKSAFDQKTLTFMDFRTSQTPGLSFFYTVPEDERTALVTYTCAAGQPVPAARVQTAFENYLNKTLKIQQYQSESKETGFIPLTSYRYSRRPEKHILAIGSCSGMIKPSTSYAFQRIQNDSEAIAASLLKHGHPFNIPPSSRFFRLCDSLWLGLIQDKPEVMSHIFERFFRNNPPERFFDFLDEATTWRQNLQILASLPPGPFIKQLLKNH
jgi:lycopene beta-cyclase